jgi:hypothetical protein
MAPASGTTSSEVWSNPSLTEGDLDHRVPQFVNDGGSRM